jgi:leucyl-tRNA synthetase
MILGEDNQKMSKSRGNVINPDDVVRQYGADSFRLYEMFMGPLEMTKPWATSGVEGVYRFLGKVWRLFMDKDGNLHPNIQSRASSQTELRALHQAIRKVTEDLESLRFNTSISALMIFVNEISAHPDHSREVLEKFLLLLSVFAPHLSEELWQKMGHSGSLAYEPWPEYDDQYLAQSEYEMAILVAGKVRAKMMVSAELGQEEIRKKVLEQPRVREIVGEKQIIKMIVVPGRRTVNLVLGPG